jgi:ASC-1-like (ASCH) protein
MEGGVKTVFVMPNSLQWSVASMGDRIEFDDLGSITLGMIRRYETIEVLLAAEGFGNVVPEAESSEHAADLLRNSAGWDKKSEEDKGVLALRVRSAKRKS